MITIKNISKTFYQKKQSFKALDDVSLEIEKGDIVGVIGFSGAGKSTLIRSGTCEGTQKNRNDFSAL